MISSSRAYSFKNYINFWDEEIYVLNAANYVNNLRKEMYPNNVSMKELFLKELQAYLMCIKYEKMFSKYVILNNHKLYKPSVIAALDEMDIYGNNNYFYIMDVINNLYFACKLDIEKKFYLPRKRFVDFDEDEYKKIVNIANGVGYPAIREFLHRRGVISRKDLDEIYKDCSFADIVDNQSVMDNLYVLVSKSLVVNKDIINNEDLIYSDILPIFYEKLYIRGNKSIKCDIPFNKYSQKLYNNYRGETFLEVVRKLSKML